MKASARPFQLLGLFVALAGCSRAPDTFERVAEAQSEVDDPACKDIHPHVVAGFYNTEAHALKNALKDCKQQCCMDLCMCDETSIECKNKPGVGWYCQGKDAVNVPGGVEHRATCRDLKRPKPGGGGGAGGAGAAGGAGGIVITPGSDSSLETCEAAGGAGGSPSTGGSGGSPGTTTGSGGSPATGGGM